jgi:nitrite reductase (NO-forming)
MVRLETREVPGPLADGVEYVFWTFGGRVPGSFIRVREGDLVAVQLSNHPESRMPHNIDLHALTGPGGGAATSLVSAGESTRFEFQALTPGLYVYHCGTAPVGMHIANGMYGLMLVEPAAGLRPVDREYYVMQSEFYTDGRFGEGGLRRFSMEKGLAESPDYVVFNGAAGSLLGDGTLSARVGERIRLYVGNAGPTLATAFHITGEIFDRVFLDGSPTPILNAQTVHIPPGGAAMVEFTVEVPGTYALVDHAVFRAFNRGALATLRVSGPENRRVYAGRPAEGVYLQEGGIVQAMPAAADSARGPLAPLERLEAGRRVYSQICQACHQASGQGIPGTFPPLAGSDFLNANPRRAIGILIHGFSGPITVNGKSYNSAMPALRLTDDDIANVLSYVYSQWGNSGAVISVEEVRQVRVCPWCEGGRR